MLATTVQAVRNRDLPFGRGAKAVAALGYQLCRRVPFFAIFLVFLLLQSAYSQTANIDSLMAIWQDEQRSDSVRIDALDNACFINGFLLTQPDSTLFYCEQGYAFSEERKFTNGMILMLRSIGTAHYVKGEFRQAIEILEEGVELSNKQGNNYKRESLLNNLANSYSQLAEYARAIEIYYQLLAQYEKEKKEKDIHDVMINIGTTYMNMSKPHEALDIYLSVLAYYKGENQLGTDDGLIDLLNTAKCYYNLQQLDSARHYHQQLLTNAKANEHPIFEREALIGLGQVAYYSGSSQQATTYLRKAMAMEVGDPGRLHEALCLLSLALAYQDMQPDSAIILAKEALGIYTGLGELHYIRESYQILSDIYAEQGRYKLALEMAQQQQLYEDSILREENQRVLFETEASYEYEKKKLADQIVFEQELAQQKLNAQRTFYLIGGTAIIFILILVSILKVRQTRSQMERDALLHEIELLRERVATQSVSSLKIKGKLELDKARIEEYLGAQLGESSWAILNIIFKNPSVTNKAIAEEVFLSVEGVSSSLRRMYKSFGVQSKNSKNLKVALVTKAVKISLGEPMSVGKPLD